MSTCNYLMKIRGLAFLLDVRDWVLRFLYLRRHCQMFKYEAVCYTVVWLICIMADVLSYFRQLPCPSYLVFLSLVGHFIFYHIYISSYAIAVFMNMFYLAIFYLFFGCANPQILSSLVFYSFADNLTAAILCYECHVS